MQTVNVQCCHSWEDPNKYKYQVLTLPELKPQLTIQQSGQPSNSSSASHFASFQLLSSTTTMKFTATRIAITSLFLGALQPVMAIPLESRVADIETAKQVIARQRPKSPRCKDLEGYYLCVAVGLLGCFSGPGQSGNQACQGAVGDECSGFFFLCLWLLQLLSFLRI